MAFSEVCVGMRVRIIDAVYHKNMIGKTGTVKKAVKKTGMIWITMDEPECTPNGIYGAYPKNIERVGE